ncbi:MAG: ABC transporter ATP-binding protein [Phycisphaerales bacterium]
MLLPTSRQRYREYLERRRRDAAKSETAGATEPKRSNDWTAERGDPLKMKPGRSFWVLLREFWKLLRGHQGRVTTCLVVAAVVGMLSVVNPLFSKLVFDYVITDHPGPSGLPAPLNTYSPVTLLWIIGGAMVALTAFAATLGTWSRYQLTALTQILRVTTRRRTFRHMQKLPLHKLHHLKSGGVASILREDAAAPAELLFQMLYNPVRSVVVFVGGLGFMAWIDWRLLVGGLLLGPFVYLSHKTWIGRVRPVHREIKQTRTTTDAHATEAFGGSRIVRAFGRQTGELNRFGRNTHLMSRQELLAWIWMRAIEVAWVLIGPLATAGALIYGGWQILEGRLTIGDVAAFTSYLFMLIGPMETLVNVAGSMQTNLAGFDRVLDVWAEPTEFAAPAGGATLKRVRRGDAQGRVALENVSFHYPNNQELVLRGINLDVQAGETIALVGASGSGKTTLCNLVARFFDPTSGRITLDGTDLRDIDVADYRRLLGIVEQDVFLFDGTVTDNIAYARRSASEVDVFAAARAANADGFVEKLEKGYDTIIGERGVRLSGGQKQRIAIARALLADPKILILDEATSSLDSESEGLIQRSLVQLMRGRTCFVIAHRLSTIRHADRIVVLEKGEVLEVGSHDQLLAHGGRYWRMLRTQLDPASMGDEDLPAAANEAAAG